MAKHDKTNFRWTTPIVETTHISYDPPRDEYYKARISTLERENAALHEKIEKNAALYGMGRDAVDGAIRELSDECDRLRDENAKLQQALIREALRDVQV